MIRILKKLFRRLAPYKGRLYLGIVLSMVNNLLGFVPVLCGVYAIRMILDDRSGGAKMRPTDVILLAAVMVGSIFAALAVCLYPRCEAGHHCP